MLADIELRSPRLPYRETKKMGFVEAISKPWLLRQSLSIGPGPAGGY